MTPQKVLLFGNRSFFREIVTRALVKSPEFEVVAELATSSNLSSIIRKKHPDWIILSIAPGESIDQDICKLLLTEFPYLHVMGISTDGSQVKTEWIGLHEKDYQAINLESLLNILRMMPES